MELGKVVDLCVAPALALLPSSMGSSASRVMLLAIGLQESRFNFRRQMGNGPARGFWQFEKGGGVKGVMTHSRTFLHAQALCKARGVQFTPAQIWNALERDDVLAAGFARLLLWSDPASLPNNYEGGWQLYNRTWRPGKPHPETWPDYFEMSKVIVMG